MTKIRVFPHEELCPEGKEIEAPVKQPGFHVNYLGPLPTGWDKKAVNPKTPVRVFA